MASGTLRVLRFRSPWISRFDGQIPSSRPVYKIENVAGAVNCRNLRWWLLIVEIPFLVKTPYLYCFYYGGHRISPSRLFHHAWGKYSTGEAFWVGFASQKIAR